MEALEFLKEAKRKCSSTTCEVCHNESYAVLCPLSEYPDEKLEKLVSGIEQWSEEHPIITNARKFEEVFGRKPQYCNGKSICPVPMLAHSCFDLNCTTCVEWWDEPYKEPEHDG